MDDSRPSRTQQLKLYEGWLEHKSTTDFKWKKLWCVLKGRMLYFFISDSTEEKNHKGTLAVTSDTHFDIKDGSPQKGWRFELYTGKRLNKFKSKMFSERELWRAYIMGICSGDIPPSVDLPPAEQREVQSKLRRCLQVLQAPSVPQSESPASSRSTGLDSASSRSARLDSASSRSARLDSSSSQSTGLDSPHDSADGVFAMPVSDAASTVSHRFWKDASRTDKPPWFFEGITRTDAERILQQCGFHGNTLMRESVTFRSTGSYVITKLMQRGCVEFNHFEVIRVNEGFRINVENDHTPMACLSEVMDFFVQISGLQSTHPMTTNNPKDLIMDVPDYQTKIVRTAHDDESGEELDEEYEEPQNISSGPPKTWSQPKMNREMGHNHGSHTMAVSQHGLRSAINQDELVNRVNAAMVVNEFDRTLNLYSDDDSHTLVPDRTYSYENESVIENLRGLSQAPPPPGPPPCPGKPVGRSYVNNPMSARDRRSSGAFLNDSSHPVKAQQYRSRSKSVPNVIPPGCNFTVSVPTASELPAPGIVAPPQAPAASPVTTPVSVPVSRLKNQFQQQTSSSTPARRLSETPHRKDSHKVAPPVKQKTWYALQKQHSIGSGRPPAYDLAVGVTNKNVEVTNKLRTRSVCVPSEYYVDACPATFPVSFSLPGDASKGDNSGGCLPVTSGRQPLGEAAACGAERTSETGVTAKPNGAKNIKAELEGIFARGPKKPSNQVSPPVQTPVQTHVQTPGTDSCDEDYEDISNYVNVD